MQVFRVALLQMTAGSSQEENQRKGLDWCRRAKAMGADLALFPEMWNTGYAMTEDEQALRQNAVEMCIRDSCWKARRSEKGRRP